MRKDAPVPSMMPKLYSNARSVPASQGKKLWPPAIEMCVQR